MKAKKLLCMVLSALMVFSLAACGKNKTGDSNLLNLGDYELLYKSACIMPDSEGNDALVMTLDFTNNSEYSVSYLWSVIETVTQNGEELPIATIYTGTDTFSEVMDSQFEEVAPGATLEIQTAFILKDTTSTIEALFQEMLGDKSGTITIDPSTLSRETADSGSAAAETGDPLLDWWNGDWYGWWTMTGCWGAYEDLESAWWDVCGTIDIGADGTGTVILWDEDYTRAEPMVSASVSLNEAGTGEYGTLMSEGGAFMDIPLVHADWIVDPGLVEFPDMIHIDGFYENGDDEFTYDIFLRPWGTRWGDMSEEDLPLYYYDWYLPLIEAGAAMPDVIGTEVPADTGTPAGGSTGTPSASASDAAPSGDGIVTEEQVQKGWVYMSEVADDIFNTTFEELSDYFGVQGQFVKEEYSEHMQVNKRYYKWISSENSSHFLYVNFEETEPGVYEVCGYNTSGFSGTEAVSKYLDAVKAEAA